MKVDALGGMPADQLPVLRRRSLLPHGSGRSVDEWCAFLNGLPESQYYGGGFPVGWVLDILADWEADVKGRSACAS